MYKFPLYVAPPQSTGGSNAQGSNDQATTLKLGGASPGVQILFGKYNVQN